MSSNPYSVLGVKDDATQDDIKKAYRALALKFHPDRAGKTGLDDFRKITQAYEQIEDPVKRKEYDASRASSGGFAGGRPRGGPFTGAPAEDLSEEELRDFQRAYGHRFTQDPFENVFNKRAKEEHAAWERKFSEYEQKIYKEMWGDEWREKVKSYEKDYGERYNFTEAHTRSFAEEKAGAANNYAKFQARCSRAREARYGNVGAQLSKEWMARPGISRQDRLVLLFTGFGILTASSLVAGRQGTTK